MREKIIEIIAEIKKGLHPYKQLILQFAITALSALVIGAVFGIFFLQLSHEDEMNIQSKTTQVSGDKSKKILPSISFYLVQAGLYAERKNAEQRQAELAADKQDAAIWQDQAGYYLFTALAKNETKIREKNKDEESFFIKEWTIAEKNLSLTKDEAEFFDDLYEVLQTAITELDEQTPNLAPWQNLRQAAVKTEKTQAFLDFMDKSLVDQAEIAASFDLFLLEILYLYENLTKD